MDNSTISINTLLISNLSQSALNDLQTKSLGDILHCNNNGIDMADIYIDNNYARITYMLTDDSVNIDQISIANREDIQFASLSLSGDLTMFIEGTYDEMHITDIEPGDLAIDALHMLMITDEMEDLVNDTFQTVDIDLKLLLTTSYI